jgi:hypothetical protein
MLRLPNVPRLFAPRLFAPRLVALSLAPLCLALAAPARAETPIAPGLATASAHALVEGELRALVQALPASTRPRVTGLYVAFEASPNDASILAACDDDGDYVIAITDAMLTLIDAVAQAQASDELLNTHKRDDYAAFLAKEQTRGARLLPPPPGFFDAPLAGDPQVSSQVTARARLRMREALDGLLAHEIAHVTAGDLACPRPTATRERGDAEWTRAEAQAANDGAAKIYTASRIVTADAAATTLLLTAHDGASDAGYAAILAFFEQVPASAYAHVHDAPLGAAARLRAQVVAAAAASHKASQDSSGMQGATKNGSDDANKKH